MNPVSYMMHLPDNYNFFISSFENVKGIMTSRIIERKKIELNAAQTRMVISGWSNEVYENSVVEKITYLSDGLKVKGYLAYPVESSGKLPCIIWNRGGLNESGAIDSFTARGMFGLMASWGYIVLASQYRGNAGGEGKEQLGGDDVNDILNLIPIADEITHADTDKWGIEGWSRGGMMTYLTLRRNSNFKCAVLAGAISSLKLSADDNPNLKENYKKVFSDGDIEKELLKRSALNFAGELPAIPYLIMHGGADETVSPQQSFEIAKKFSERKIPYRLVIFEGGDHYIKTHRKDVEQLKRMWYDKYLKVEIKFKE